MSDEKLKILTISELNHTVSTLLERNFPVIWVCGEISNFTQAASGHWYFILKDKQAQVRAVMFRGRNQIMDWHPKEGDAIEAQVLVSLYEARGEFQLNVEIMRRAGQGSLYEQFMQRKQKLALEGCFDAAHKRVLPEFPLTIGIVTSPQAAALQDVLTALKRRAAHVSILIYPSLVQGVSAPSQLLHALSEANRTQECDVLLLVRGGGSLEDLWAFNDEQLVRFIAQSSIPVVSGIGHETDFTLVDFAADMRAPTPTAAAELASAGWYAAPSRLDYLLHHLRKSQYRVIQTQFQRVDLFERHLLNLHPRRSIQLRQQRLGYLAIRLAQAFNGKRRGAIQHMSSLGAQLNQLNPKEVLARGYSITRTMQLQVITSSRQVHKGEKLQVELAQGGLEIEVVHQKGT